MEKLPVHCHTNLDDYIREIWPTEFLCTPRVGDYVTSQNGKRLVICAITHSNTKLDIELTKTYYAPPIKY